MDNSFKITPIPAFNDNYLWLVSHPDGRAVVVDPGDANPVFTHLNAHSLTLNAILITHHHHDHIGGINQLVSSLQVPVYGPDTGLIPQISHTLSHGDKLSLFNGEIALEVMAVPGHTRDHIAYFGVINDQPTLFCGDTLFAAGCGRIFDGTHQQLYQSLQQLNQLPEDTYIYCTHEYTLANLAFAQQVEPDNAAVQSRIKNEQNKRAQQLPTLPTQLRLERETNPFLRCGETNVIAAVNRHWQSEWTSGEDLFTGLRRWKDNF